MNVPLVARGVVKSVIVQGTNIQLSRYLTFASYAVLIYDLVLTLPDEINLIWTAKWSIVNLLFLINRYTVPVVITLNLGGISGLSETLTKTVRARYCQHILIILLYWQLISLASVHVIVALRIHAVLGRRLNVFVSMSCLLVLTYVATFALAAIVMGRLFGTIDILAFPGPGPVCTASPNSLIWAIWLPGLVFEGVICMITFIRVWWHMEVESSSFRLALNCDGAIYASIEFLARLFVVLVWVVAPESLMILGEYFAFAVTSAVCSRLLLNLKGVRNKEDWSQATSLLEIHPNGKTPDLWLADQGGEGLSFLEQIYQRSHSSGDNPRVTEVDQFTVSVLENGA